MYFQCLLRRVHAHSNAYIERIFFIKCDQARERITLSKRFANFFIVDKIASTIFHVDDRCADYRYYYYVDVSIAFRGSDYIGFFFSLTIRVSIYDRTSGNHWLYAYKNAQFSRTASSLAGLATRVIKLLCFQVKRNVNK